MKKHPLACFQWSILDLIVDFFFPRHEDKLFGKLFVSGRGQLEFSFKKKPGNVSIHFENECDPTPCNPCDPGVEDYLAWDLEKHRRHYVLNISWDVETARTIVWKVC